MSDDERRLLETGGEYCFAVKNGEVNENAPWRSCQLLLTTRRLVVSTAENERTLPLSSVVLVTDPPAIDAAAAAADFVALALGDSVLFVSTGDADVTPTFARALLDGETILVREPGAADDDRPAWAEATVRAATQPLSFEDIEEAPEIALDAVRTVETTTDTVRGEERTVVSVDVESGSNGAISTTISGDDATTTTLVALLSAVAPPDSVDTADLDEAEREVLLALYSDVSPLEVPAFVGRPVEEVEATFRRLLDAGAVDDVRTRTEVELTELGRNLASDAMNEDA